MKKPGRRAKDGEIAKPFGWKSSATERMEAAREQKSVAVTRELLVVVGLARKLALIEQLQREVRLRSGLSPGSPDWRAFLMSPEREQTGAFAIDGTKGALFVLDGPLGRVVYRITAEEMESGLFDHLGDIQPNDHRGAADKIMVFDQLARGVA
jgi:hypothetical protein